MGKKNEVLDILKWMGIIVIGGVAGAGGMYLVMDGIENHYASMSHGIPLFKDGIHMKKGDHKFVITDNFYNLLSYDTPEEDQKMVIDGLKEAYTTLDNYNSQLNFKLATTVDEVAEKYNIPKVDKIGQQDIPLYMTEEVLDGNKYVMAHTDWKYNLFSFEMEKLSITFKKNYALSVWNQYDTIEKTLAPKNTSVYTTAVHESMHAMGLAHIDDHESIMNTYVKYNSPKDLTEYDIEILDKYNVQFYGAESTLKTSEDYLKTAATYAKAEEELGM